MVSKTVHPAFRIRIAGGLLPPSAPFHSYGFCIRLHDGLLPGGPHDPKRHAWLIPDEQAIEQRLEFPPQDEVSSPGYRLPCDVPGVPVRHRGSLVGRSAAGARAVATVLAHHPIVDRDQVVALHSAMRRAS